MDALGGQLPARAGTIFLPAHDEYYSLGMRAALSQAMNSGVNVANLGANTAYRLITFTDGTRRAWDVDRYTDGYNSITWRYLGDAMRRSPCWAPNTPVPSPGAPSPPAPAGSSNGIPAGTTIPGFVAGEIGWARADLYRHPGLTVVAASSGICRSSGQPAPMLTTTFTLPSGDRILNGSTSACFLVARCPSNWTVPTPSAQSQRTVGTMVANITEWVSRGQIQVPSDTTIAAVRAAVPKHHLEINNQP